MKLASFHEKWHILYALLFLLIITSVCAATPQVLSLLQANQQLPSLDPEPILTNGGGLLSFQILVKSKQLGLNVVVVQGMKFLLAQETGLEMQGWYLRNASVTGNSQSIYLVLLKVVVPAVKLQLVDQAVSSFIESGALAERFAAQGVAGIQFYVVEDGQSDADGVISSPTSPSPPPSPSPLPDCKWSINISLLSEQLPLSEPGMQYSSLDLYVRSPTIFFPVRLRQTIKWFISGETETRLKNDLNKNWFMSGFYVINTTLGQYIATFTFYGNISITERVVSKAKVYVANQELTEALLKVNAKDINVSLLPELKRPEPIPVLLPPAGLSEVVVMFRISAPITGISQELVNTVQRVGGRVTSTNKADWRLKAVEEESANGPFLADFSVNVKEGEEVESVRNVTNLVRKRELDVVLWNAGLIDVRIFARPRLTTFYQGQTGSGTSAIASTTGTVAASIVGMSVVVIIAAGILRLVPKAEHTFGASGSDATGLRISGNGKRR